ncbi:RNA binding motif protein 12Bb [Pholidichthys leucotaenia]
MVVVIRLQGLSYRADTEDIRAFFTGLSIPDGGVHIIGGKLEEAFIIFASDEDARRAMRRSGGIIRDSPVTLLLSSDTEMQKMLEQCSQNAALTQAKLAEDDARVVHRALDREMGSSSSGRRGYTPHVAEGRGINRDEFPCLFLKGLPYSASEKEILEFFSGLAVSEIILHKNARNQNDGTALVLFATHGDALGGLKRNKEHIGSRYILISRASFETWCQAGGRLPIGPVMNEELERGKSPFPSHNPQHRVRSRSPGAQRNIDSMDEEYCVLLDNLSFAAEKEDIKRLFCNARLKDDQILCLLDKDGKRTRSAFVLFQTLRDYCDALSQDGSPFLHRQLRARPISREKIINLLRAQNTNLQQAGRSEMFGSSPYPSESHDLEKTCVLVQNLPFDIRKVELVDFFHGYDITEDRVFLLRDQEHGRFGKAVVVFGSETEAVTSTLALNGRRFLGSEVILECISRSQMKQLVFDPSVQERLPREEGYRSSEQSYHSEPRNLDLRSPPVEFVSASDISRYNYEGSDYDPRVVRPHLPQYRGDGAYENPVDRSDGPTCVQLSNLPFRIKSDEIYDFCYGYNFIPESLSLQYNQSGQPTGFATLMFESRHGALVAIAELSGRPIGRRNIQLQLV